MRDHTQNANVNRRLGGGCRVHVCDKQRVGVVGAILADILGGGHFGHRAAGVGAGMQDNRFRRENLRGLGHETNPAEDYHGSVALRGLPEGVVVGQDDGMARLLELLYLLLNASHGCANSEKRLGCFGDGGQSSPIL